MRRRIALHIGVTVLGAAVLLAGLLVRDTIVVIAAASFLVGQALGQILRFETPSDRRALIVGYGGGVVVFVAFLVFGGLLSRT